MSYLTKADPDFSFKSKVYMRKSGINLHSFNDLKAQTDNLKDGASVTTSIPDVNFKYEINQDVTFAGTAAEGDALLIQNIDTASHTFEGISIGAETTASVYYNGSAWGKTAEGYNVTFAATKLFLYIGKVKDGLSVSPDREYQELENGDRVKTEESLKFSFDILEVAADNYAELRENVDNQNIDIVLYTENKAQVLYNISPDVLPNFDENMMSYEVDGMKSASSINSFYKIFKG